jgi:predicted transcriptional regulator
MSREHHPEGSRGGWRRSLGALTHSAIRVLHRLTRRLGYPALATVPVSAAMLSRLETVNGAQPLEDVAQLFVGGRCHQVPVVADDGLPVGVVTRDDVATAVQVLGPHAHVSEAPRHEVVTVGPSESLASVLDQLRGSPDLIAVVVDHGDPVGVVTLDSLTAYAAGATKLS